MVCSSFTTSGTCRVNLKRQGHNLIWKFDLLHINIKYIKLNIFIYRLVSFCSYILIHIVIIIIQNKAYVVHRQAIADLPTKQTDVSYHTKCDLYICILTGKLYIDMYHISRGHLNRSS